MTFLVLAVLALLSAAAIAVPLWRAPTDLAGGAATPEEEIEQAARKLRRARAGAELRCPRCGRAYQPGDRFCVGCGAALAPAAGARSACPACGAALREGDQFCPRCGRAVGAHEVT